MIGLEHIVKTYQTSYSEVARKIGVTPSTVIDWSSQRRPITAANKAKLAELFQIDERYISKEINQVEKIQIEINYLNQRSEKESYSDSYMDINDEGKEYEATFWVDPYEMDLRIKQEELAVEKLILQIKGIMIHESFSSQFEEDKYFRLFERITKLIENITFDVVGQDDVEPSPEYEKVETLIKSLTIMEQDKNIYGFEGVNEGFEHDLAALFQKYKIIQ